VKGFIRITGIADIQAQIFETLHGLWNISGFENNVREFLFKFMNNSLGTNTRISHFNNDRDRWCYLCKRETPSVLTEETFKHLFSACNTGRRLKEGFLTKFFPEWTNINNEEWERLWLIGIHPGANDKINLFICLTAYLCNFYIWSIKLKRIRGSVAGMSEEVIYSMRGAITVNNKINEQRTKVNFPFCRAVE
jgi:hypothetical protein